MSLLFAGVPHPIRKDAEERSGRNEKNDTNRNYAAIAPSSTKKQQNKAKREKQRNDDEKYGQI